MSKSTLLITNICVFFALLIMIMASGCTSTSSGSAGTSSVTLASSAAVPSSPTVASDSTQSATPYPLFGAGIVGNVYGSASNPSAGIDTIQFYLAPARSIDLTKWEIIVTPVDNTPVTYEVGTSNAIGTFTVTNEEGKIVTSTRVPFTVSIKMAPIPPGTKVRIEMRPSGGTTKDDDLDIYRTMPLTSGSKTPIFE
jgi:hypothetical protein